MGIVRNIMLDAIDGMQSLGNTYGTVQELLDDVARQSGVSESMTRKLYYGAMSNPGVKVLDKIVEAVDHLTEKRL